MPATSSDMRPSLRADVFFVPAADGTGAMVMNRGRFLKIPGRSTYSWLERLEPYLDGSATLTELTSALAPQRKVVVERLVTTLVEAGLVRDLARDESHGLTSTELETYGSEIGYIESFRDSPARRFERYRRTPQVVWGWGRCLVAYAEAALHSGAGSLTLRVTDRGATDLARLAECRATALARDPLQRLDWSDADADDAPDPGGVTVAIADALDADLALALDRAGARTGRPTLMVAVLDDEAWVGPYCDGSPDGPRWADLWYRRQPSEGAGGFLTGPVPGIVANYAVFKVFEALTGVAEPGTADALRIDLESLRTEQHRVVPHPFARDLRDGPVPVDAPIPSTVELLDRIEALCDARLGIVGSIDDQQFDQFPLRVAYATVLGPPTPGEPGKPGSGGGSSTLVAGHAVEFGQARAAAAVAGFTDYATRFVDPRRLLAPDGAPPATAFPARWPDLAGHLVEGWSLPDWTPATVPAALAFPPGGAAEAVGVAAGWSRDAVVADALLQLHALDRVRAGVPFRRLTVTRDALQPSARRLLSLLELTEQRFAVYEAICEPLPNVLVCTLKDRPVACVAARNRDDGLADGLSRLLLAYQAEFSEQPAYAPTVPAGIAIRTAGVEEYRSDGAAFEPAALVPALTAALREPGGSLVAVPLNHDPLVATVLPLVVRVVRTDG